MIKRMTNLEDLLHTTGNLVVFFSHNIGVEDSGCGVKWIHGWVDTQFGDATGQHRGGVQVSEGGSRGRVSQIVSRHVDGLN